VDRGTPLDPCLNGIGSDETSDRLSAVYRSFSDQLHSSFQSWHSILFSELEQVSLSVSNVLLWQEANIIVIPSEPSILYKAKSQHLPGPRVRTLTIEFGVMIPRIQVLWTQKVNIPK
jgi:hypothetical protein